MIYLSVQLYFSTYLHPCSSSHTRYLLCGFLKESIAEGVIELMFVRSEEQLVNIRTKRLAYPWFEEYARRVFLFTIDCDGDSDC